MGKLIGGILVVLLVGLLIIHTIHVILTGIGWHKHDSVAAVSRDVPEPITYIGADQLCNEYHDNEIAADIKYKGQVLAVYGYIDAIGKDTFLDELYVHFPGVHCVFDKRHTRELASLKNGQFLTVKGRCDGKTLGVGLKECSIWLNRTKN